MSCPLCLLNTSCLSSDGSVRGLKEVELGHSLDSTENSIVVYGNRKYHQVVMSLRHRDGPSCSPRLAS